MVRHLGETGTILCKRRICSSLVLRGDKLRALGTVRHLPVAPCRCARTGDAWSPQWCDSRESTGPFQSMINVPEHLVGKLEKELRLGWERNKAQARIEAKQNAKFNKMRHRSVEGLGQKIATIPLTAYHFWGQKLGYGCWDSKAFMDEFLRDNPECRVNSGGVKEISVGWTPSK